MHEDLETPEGDRKISRIAKAKEFTKNNQIKDEQRVILRDLDMIMGRLKGYFDKLLNGENRRFVSEDLATYGDTGKQDCITYGIYRSRKGVR